MSQEEKCPKCGRDIDKQNIVMHKLHCNGPPVRTNPSQGNNVPQTQPSNSHNIECEFCHLSLPEKEMKDHKLAHQIQNEERQNEDSNEIGAQQNFQSHQNFNQQMNNMQREMNRGMNNMGMQMNMGMNNMQNQMNMGMSNMERQMNNMERQMNIGMNSMERQMNRGMSNMERQMNIGMSNMQNQMNRGMNNMNSQISSYINNGNGNLEYHDAQNSSENVITREETFPNGFRQVTKEKNLPNGGKVITKITFDRNGNQISKTSSFTSGRGSQNIISNTFNTNTFQPFPGMFVSSFGSNSSNNPFFGFSNNLGTEDIQGTFLQNPLFSGMYSLNALLQGIEEAQRPRDHPVPKELVDELPEITIDDTDKLDKEKKDCVICLTPFKKGEKATILPCIHIFHSDCIKSWFEAQDTCPICKFKVSNESLNENLNENSS